MSLHDQAAFLSSIHPFEYLNSKDLTKSIEAMDINYHSKNTTLISPENISDSLYIIIKGEVGEYQDDELVKVYHNMDIFDADTLIYQKTAHTFKVTEELICYEMPKEAFKTLLESNKDFKSYFITDLANKIQARKQKEYSTQLSGFMIARISESYLHEPCVVSKDTPVIEAIRKMEEKKANCILVEKEDGLGIVTDSIMRRQLILAGYDHNAPIGKIAISPVITVEHDDFLFNALLTLTKHSIKRVVVTKGEKVIGVLEQLDLLSYFANHTYLVAVQIKKAKSLEELKVASLDFINIVKKLSAKGVKVEYISKLISELNEKIYEKLYDMLVPKELAQKACLIVMGSEGRREQILKTDQDNALIIHDDTDPQDFYPYMHRFSETLIDFGFPKCPGNIMVSNPYWCKTQKEFHDELITWQDSPTAESYMNLAIFFDSIAVAGDKELLTVVKQPIFDGIEHKDVFMANFAKAALSFETPIGLFTNLITEHDKIDLKKGGLFPIVQGVRSMALRNRIDKTDTISRLHELKKQNVLDEESVSEIIEAFDTLLSIRLKQRLRNLEKDKSYDNKINPNELNKLEIDLLKDSFKIVNKFKKTLTHYFKLNMVS